MPLHLLSIAFFLMLLASVVQADDTHPSNTLRLTDGSGQHLLGRHLLILEDPGGRRSFEDIFRAPGDFKPSQSDVPNFGISHSVFWLKLRVENSSPVSSVWYLEYADPMYQYVDLWMVSTNGATKQIQAGSLRARSAATVEARGHVFPVEVPGTGSTDLYVRISTGYVNLMPMTLWNPQTFAEQQTKEGILHGIYIGIVFSMLLYNMFVYTTFRDSAYLYYVSFMFTQLLVECSLNGTIGVYLFPTSPVLGNLVFVGAYEATTICSCFFTISFLSLKRREKQLMQLIAGALALCGLSGILFGYHAWTLAFQWTVPFSAISALVIGIRCVIRKDRSAIYYVAGYGWFLISCVVFAVMTMGVLPYSPLTFYSVEIGSALEAILLSLALAHRVKRIKDEKDKAQHDVIVANDLKVAAQQQALTNQQRALDSERKAVENLQRMDKLKDDFLANTSHELRTPLNGIIGLAEASLHLPTASPLSPNLRQNLEMIVTSGRRLGSLVNDILDFSKLRHEDIVLSPKAVDMSAVVELVVALSQPLLRGRDIALTHDVPAGLPLAWADENRLQQILHNLIGNALKFTRQGEVEVSVAEADAGLLISVRDTGIGIPADRIEEIFESFNQGDGSIQREFGGTGLGLSITRRLIELHGGSITVESVVDLGTVFRFTLPSAQAGIPPAEQPVLRERAAAPAAPDAMPEQVVAHLPGLDAGSDLGMQGTAGSVLVVDDEPINRQVLKAQLLSAGFSVVEAADGEEALQALEKPATLFDLVLLDVMMPRLSGFETCRRMRERFPALQLPIIFLTAKSQTEDVLSGFSAGGNDYLIKPFSRDELLARIRIHLELKIAFRVISEYSRNLEQRVAERTRDLVDAQQQLVLKQKMSALGVLTAGVAHEINNPNNFVRGAFQNLEAWRDEFKRFVYDLLEEDAELTVAFDEHFGRLNQQLSLIDTGTHRIDGVVKGLRAVTCLDESDQKNSDVIEGLEQILMLLQSSIPSYVKIELDCPVRPRVLCWAAEINQVFMNVLANAIHAISERQRQEKQLVGMIRISNSLSDGRFRVLISDNGVGMSAEVLQRACDPFFTTKEVGSGSGLGLSISRDIMRKHRGSLTLMSTEGEGTLVTLEMPV